MKKPIMFMLPKKLDSREAMLNTSAKLNQLLTIREDRKIFIDFSEVKIIVKLWLIGVFGRLPEYITPKKFNEIFIFSPSFPEYEEALNDAIDFAFYFRAEGPQEDTFI